MLMRRRRLWLMAMALLMLSLAGCRRRTASLPVSASAPTSAQAGEATVISPSRATPTLEPLGPEPATPRPTPNPRRPEPPRPGAVAFDFTLPDLQGQDVSLSQFRGKRVVLNFWATWCGPCQFEIPVLARAYKEYRDQGLEIVAVNLREHPDRVTRFVANAGMTFPVLLDANGQVAQSYFIRGIPTSVFVDEEGVIQAVHVGVLTESMLKSYIMELML